MAADPITTGRPAEWTPGTGTFTSAEIARGLADRDARRPAAAYHRWEKPVHTPTPRRSPGDARDGRQRTSPSGCSWRPGRAPTVV
ncbi:hypothetical protein ABZV34_39905, partial [Streptomyces sp. NPDC005195]